MEDRVGAYRTTATFLAVATLLGSLAASPALACSLAAPADMDQLITTGTADELSERPVLAVYEQRHIAWTPGLLLRTERSASIVTRYWGPVEPPLGVRVHGEGLVGFLGFDECGNSASSNGHVEFEVLVSERAARSGFWTDIGDLTLDEVRRGLSERFGAPTEISTGMDDFVAAYALLLWPPAAAIAALALGVVGLRRWRRTDREYALDVPVSIAGAAAVVVASFVVEDFGVVDRVLLAVAVGLAIGAGRILGPLLGWASGALGVAGLITQGRHAFESGDVVLWIGFWAVITGIGHLVWHVGHASRLAATVGIGAGGAMIIAGWAWRLGATSRSLVLATAVASFVVITAFVWWVVIGTARRRPTPDTIDA